MPEKRGLGCWGLCTGEQYTRAAGVVFTGEEVAVPGGEPSQLLKVLDGQRYAAERDAFTRFIQISMHHTRLSTVQM